MEFIVNVDFADAEQLGAMYPFVILVDGIAGDLHRAAFTHRFERFQEVFDVEILIVPARGFFVALNGGMQCIAIEAFLIDNYRIGHDKLLTLNRH
ncbi:MAG: hypothetical protein IKF56_04875 [Eggerthellaceae bacterium]|nr:hypothetical protein [Eggerthellaceae bacterium]